ncbi:MAG TPA: hypothetical protein VKE22_28585 [Haliangiales bacterium]|nr:hypothetical protein [Haliangiales bacterium]
MKIQLRNHENILHPQPYVAEEKPPLVVTTMRVFYSGGAKKQELDASKITYSGKGVNKQFLALMLVFGVVAAPFLIIGGYLGYVYKDDTKYPKGPPPEVKGQPKKPVTQKQLDEFADNKLKFILGLTLLGFGAIMGGGAYLLYKRRLIVVIGGQGRALRIRVKSKMEQDKVLTMVGAAVTSAKAMAPQPMPVMKPPAPAPKK